MEGTTMAVIHGTVRNGVAVFDAPASLPEGAKVEIHLVDDPDRIGIPEDEQGDDPESIAAWIAWADQLEPLKWTDEEREQWEKGLAEYKAFELATWEARSEKLRKLFE
jgi:glycosyltransferase involved in cell wall biosynthesis